MRGKSRLETGCAFLLAIRGVLGRTQRKGDSVHPDRGGIQREAAKPDD